MNKEEIKRLIERVKKIETSISVLSNDIMKINPIKLTDVEKRIRLLSHTLGGEMFIKLYVDASQTIRIYDVQRDDEHIRNLKHQSYFDNELRKSTG